MKLLIGIFIAASAFGQVATPGVFGVMQSRPLGEELTIPLTEGFISIPYVNLIFRQEAMSNVESCQVYVQFNLFLSNPLVWLLNAEQTAWLPSQPIGQPGSGGSDVILDNGRCSVNATRSKLVADPSFIAKGSLVLVTGGLSPKFIYGISNVYPTPVTSLSRLRPVCPERTAPGQTPEFGC